MKITFERVINTKTAGALVLALSIGFIPPFAHSEDGRWTIHCKIDEMTDIRRCVALSPVAEVSGLTNWMSHRVRIGFACNHLKEEWFYAWFEGLNLNGGTIKDGYTVHYIPVRFDDVPSETVSVIVQWGADYLHFRKPDGSYNYGVLDGILDSDEMLFRLDQYGEGQKTVRISLSGSTMAISKARSDCGITLSEVKRQHASL